MSSLVTTISSSAMKVSTKWKELYDPASVSAASFASRTQDYIPTPTYGYRRKGTIGGVLSSGVFMLGHTAEEWPLVALYNLVSKRKSA